MMNYFYEQLTYIFILSCIFHEIVDDDKSSYFRTDEDVAFNVNHSLDDRIVGMVTLSSS